MYEHCQDDEYEIHVVALPDRPGEPITWQNRAVIRVDCCAALFAIIDILRHHKGVAHMGPAGSIGTVTPDNLALGEELLDEIRAYGEALLDEALKRARAPLN